MGLSICVQIIEKLGGEINVYSEGINKGSTFTFSIRMKLPGSLIVEEEKEGSQIDAALTPIDDSATQLI